METLLLVIPTVLNDGPKIAFDGDFSNNLEAYLRAFDRVVIACPDNIQQSFPTLRMIDDVPGHKRAKVLVLPNAYREDRYILRRKYVKKLLSDEIDAASHILISPHAAFCWSTLAAEICIKKGRMYNMEADWNLPETSHYIWGQMPFGLNKLRKRLWLAYHNQKYWHCLRKSSLALLQGEDVYNEYRSIAPNAHAVLNIQITESDKISPSALQSKITDASKDRPCRLVYAGRAIEMKGPLYWLETLRLFRKKGGQFEATWFGDGEMLPEMRQFVEEHAMTDCVILRGRTSRGDVFRALRQADAFLFCHMGKESPRCLVEALASGTPLIGFGSNYPRSLTRDHGGGMFAEPGDSEELASILARLDRSTLGQLISAAAESGRQLNRDKAIQHRIDLMKEYLVDRPA